MIENKIQKVLLAKAKLVKVRGGVMLMNSEGGGRRGNWRLLEGKMVHLLKSFTLLMDGSI